MTFRDLTAGDCFRFTAVWADGQVFNIVNLVDRGTRGYQAPDSHDICELVDWDTEVERVPGKAVDA